MKKKTPLKKKTSTSSDASQDETYWQSRPHDDQQRDWPYAQDTWLKDYVASVDHPHRQLIIDTLQTLQWSYLLEVGCSAGPNLIKIRHAFPEKALFGIDVNHASIEEAKRQLPNVDFEVASVHKLPFVDHYFDVVLADAVLMYSNSEQINTALDEINRVTRNAVIIVDRYHKSKSGVANHVWARNYPELMEDRGFRVATYHLTANDWPTSKNWQKTGCVFTCLRP